MDPASTSANEDRFRALAEHSDEVIVEVGPDTRLTYVSPNAGAVFGIDAAELTGLDLATIATRLDVSPKEELAGFAGPLSLGQLIARGPYQRVRRISLPNGGVHWIDIAVTEFEAANGQSRATAVVRDISQRVQLEEQLVRSQKLESLSVLAGGSAHSFNNQLTTILLNVELAISEVEDGEGQKILPYLWAVVEAASRAEETTNQLLTYAGKQALEANGLDLTSEIRSLRGFLRAVVAGRANLDFELRSWLPKVQADGKQLSQLLTHLTLNAVEACAEEGGSVVVSTGTLELEENSPDAIRTGLPPGTYVCLAVRDNGEGIEPEAQLKLFDPFFTTRTGSAGLGLAEAQGIARAHGGTIIVDSLPRQGAVFKVLLPVADRVVVLAPVDADSTAVRSTPSSGSVLVVDDEDHIRTLAAVGLRRAGYEVLTANSGRQAMALFAEHADQIDMLITDLAMPEMTGEELIAKLRRTHPDLPVLLMSGYSRAAVSDSLTKLPTIAFLQKPFLLSELVACVARIAEPKSQTRG
ncbi:MAG: response regulator [Pseudomonadota bacterium]